MFEQFNPENAVSDAKPKVAGEANSKSDWEGQNSRVNDYRYGEKTATSLPDIQLFDGEMPDVKNDFSIPGTGDDVVLHKVERKPVELKPDAPEKAVEGGDKATDGQAKGGKSEITKDEDGNVTRVKYPDGRSMEVKYDENGNQNEIKLPDGRVWKKEGEVWKGENQEGQHIEMPASTDISVGKDGAFMAVSKEGNGFIKFADGSQTEMHSDGSQRTFDKNFRPTEIVYPNKSSTEVKYDDAGNPVDVKFSSGKHWVKEDGQWQGVDKNGKKNGETFNGHIGVTDEGDVSVVPAEGDGMIKHPDGGWTTLKGNGAEITEDKDGRVTQVKRPDGSLYNYQYDDKGELEQVKLPNEQVWTKKDGEWTGVDKEGKEVPVDPIDISVTRDGDFMVADRKGDGIVIQHSDGSQTINKDNSQIISDDHERITKIVYPTGQTNTIEYDEKGEPKKISNSDKTSWVKENGSWTQYDEKGKKVDSHDGSISISDDGDIIAIDKKGGKIILDRQGNETKQAA